MTRRREPIEVGDWADDDYLAHIGQATVLDAIPLTDEEANVEFENLQARLARKVRLGFRREPLP